MIHIITKRQVDNDAGEYVVETTADSLKLTHVSTGAELVLTIADLAQYPGGAVISWSDVHKFVVVGADDLINQKDLSSYLAFARNTSVSVGTFAANETGTEAAVVLYPTVKYDGDFVLCDRACTTAEALDLVFPGTSQHKLKRRNAKAELLRKIGAHDSLAALEKQVDLLTQLVLDMIAQQSLPPSELSVLLADVVGTAGANNGVSVQTASEKVKQFKTALRQAQNAYFEGRE